MMLYAFVLYIKVLDSLGLDHHFYFWNHKLRWFVLLIAVNIGWFLFLSNVDNQQPVVNTILLEETFAITRGRVLQYSKFS